MKKSRSLLFLGSLFMLSGLMLMSCKTKTGNKEKSTESQWITLFDGTSTDGWRGYDSTSFPAHGWVIDGDALKCVGSGEGEAGGKGGDIIYDKKFKDFDLTLDWKISEGGNSGIFYLARKFQENPYGNPLLNTRFLTMKDIPMPSWVKMVTARPAPFMI